MVWEVFFSPIFSLNGFRQTFLWEIGKNILEMKNLCIHFSCSKWLRGIAGNWSFVDSSERGYAWVMSYNFQQFFPEI